jgi:hypothetical protein
MSKKGKLILATALFGAALFGASCGGGGGGGTTAGTGTGGGGGGGGGGTTPSPTVEGRVLALLNMGTVSAGTSMPVTICNLMSNGTAQCGNDLNPSEDADLRYVHEFPNGNVVLVDSDNVLYFFNGSQVIKPTSSRALSATSDTLAPGGITIPDLTATGTKVYATPNFVILVNNAGSTKELVVVTREGKVIKDTNNAGIYNVNASCEAVTKTTTFKLNVDGTSSSITTIPDEVLAQAGGKFLVKKGNDILLSSSECSISGAVNITSLSSSNYDAKMVKVGSDTFYIAVRDDRTLKYYKVTGNTLRTLHPDTGITLLPAANKYHYALDGMGVLYAITSTNEVKVYSKIDGNLIGTATVSGVANGGLLGFADSVLARDNADNVYEIIITTGGVNAVPVTAPGLFTALQRCTDASNTKDVVGMGTNFIRCVFDNNSGTGAERLVVIAYDGASAYSIKDVQINSNSVTGGSAINRNNIRFGANAVLVVTRNNSGSLGPIHLCTITTAPTLNVSCSPTDIPNPVGDLPIRDTTRIYPSTNLLKFNGDNVFYLSGTSVKLRNLFSTTPSSLPITVDSATGGNASFDLTKFAFSFQPPTALCNTHIAYLSSPTATPKLYALPSGTCVTRILKVFP